ncbi:uncharacterized protein [Acropora muricata]|uniref:uncharacterized protein n=1 Tax=Acropora muricata TaxID=159855 RepID=UPI0034E5D229
MPFGAITSSHGTLRSGLSYGPVCVQQTAIKTIQANCKQMMQMKEVKEAIQQKCPIASRVNDFHNIYMYTIKAPTDLKPHIWLQVFWKFLYPHYMPFYYPMTKQKHTAK